MGYKTQLQNAIKNKYSLSINKQIAVVDRDVYGIPNDYKFDTILFKGVFQISYNDFYIESYLSKPLKDITIVDIVFHLEIGMQKTGDTHHRFLETIDLKDNIIYLDCGS